MVVEQRPQAAGLAAGRCSLLLGGKRTGARGAREALRGVQCVGHNIIVCVLRSLRMGSREVRVSAEGW